MEFKMHGFDELDRRLNRLQKAARELDGTHDVKLSELLPKEFMKRHTNFDSVDAMFEASGFKVESQEDFERIPDDAWDALVSGRTQFANWKAMLEAAAADYARRRLAL